MTDRAPGSGSSRSRRSERSTGSWVLVFTCHPDEQTDAQRAPFGDYCTWSRPGDSPIGPWDVAGPAPSPRRRRSSPRRWSSAATASWCLIGFLNRESRGHRRDGDHRPDPRTPRGRPPGGRLASHLIARQPRVERAGHQLGGEDHLLVHVCSGLLGLVEQQLGGPVRPSSRRGWRTEVSGTAAAAAKSMSS